MLKSNEHDVQSYYDRHTKQFMAYGEGRGSGTIHRAVWGPGVNTRKQAFFFVEDRLAEAFRTLVQTTPNQTILDLGCGIAGSLCYLTQRLPVQGVGITLSPVQVQLAKKHIYDSQLQNQVTCIQGDYLDSNLQIPPIDMAYAIESFAHTDDPSKFFSHCAKRIRPGGILAICDDMLRNDVSPRAKKRIRQFSHGWRVHTLLTQTELIALAKSTGFQHDSTYDLTPYLRLGRPRDRLLAVLTALVSWLPLDNTIGHLLGGSALHTCLQNGWIGYDLTFFRRTK
jgi:cyclopropane fatty-acyl-phospholipid synthase-like methyltransferase